MATTAQRILQRTTPPTRVVRLGIDGTDVEVVMTRAEEKAFRQRLRPFVVAARACGPSSQADSAGSVRLSDQLRSARTQALLGIGSRVGSESASPEVQRLLARAAEVYSK